jgi:hypothetical protein
MYCLRQVLHANPMFNILHSVHVFQTRDAAVVQYSMPSQLFVNCHAGAFMPVLVYALFGSSKELAVGPVAVTSLLISASLKELVPHAEDITNPNNPPPDMVRMTYAFRFLFTSSNLAADVRTQRARAAF